MPRMDVFADTLAQANTVAAHPLQFKLLQKGLYPGGGRYRRNWKGLYEFHKGTRPRLTLTRRSCLAIESLRPAITPLLYQHHT